METTNKLKTIKYIVLSFLLNSMILFELIFQNVVSIPLFLLLTVIIVVIHGLVWNHFYQVNKQFNYLNQVLESILNGSLDTIVEYNDYIHFRTLNANINRLGKRIAKMVYKNEEDEQTIKNLTNNITSPIIYIDRDGRIRYVNNHFVNQFQSSVEVNDIYEKLRIQELFKFIDNTFTFETKAVSTIQIFDKFYQANAIPINNNMNDIITFVGILFIFHDITEFKKYEKLQREFLADASHELKTPISAIKGASEILLNGDKHTKETTTEFLNIIKNENERMERIVNDILLISRLECENIAIKMDSINLNKVLFDTIEIMSFKANNKKQQIITNIKDDLYIKGDYERLKHAFLNLISNAINYTNEYKAIYVTAEEDDKNIYVSIKDEGIGMDEHALPHIFERFYRIDKARSRDTGGTGLGLAIVKSTMDIHKAKIKVTSKLNKGTEFLVIFNK